jgi:hypothetical protein
MTIALICAVIFLFWLVLLAWCEWPRYVYVVRRRCWTSNTDIIVATYTKRKRAEDHVRSMVFNRINAMEWDDLLILCHELGMSGLGRQSVDILRELTIAEMMFRPSHYHVVRSWLKIYTPEAIRLQ